MIEPLPLCRGHFVTLISAGRSIRGMVVLVAENHRSLGVMVDGMIAGWVQFVPLYWTEHNGYEDLMGNSFEVAAE